MTLQEVRAYVLGNIAGRVDGFIGGESSEDAALREVNLAVKEISKHETAPEWEYIHDFTLASGASSFPLPLIGGQRTRALSGLFYESEADEYYYPLTFLIQEEFFQRLNNTVGTSSDSPQFYTYFNNTLYLWPTLSQDVTFRAYLELYPPTFTSGDLLNDLGVDPDWDTAIIAYATYKIFLRLQQQEDYVFWKREYNECVKNATHALRKRRMEPDINGANRHNYTSADPARDPMIRSWR
jgi:hypothetical protein